MVNITPHQRQWLVGSLVTVATAFIYTLGGSLGAFALVLLPFAATLAVRFSSVFLVLFILFSYFRLHEAFPFLMPFKLPKLLALASLVGITWHLFISKRLSPFWHSGLFVFSLFFVWLTIACIMAVNPSIAMTYWSGILTKVFIMVFAISWWVKSVSAFSWIRLGISLSGISVALVALYNKFQGIGLVEGTRVTISRELRSQLGDPNDLSLVLMFAVSFLAAEVFNPHAKKIMRLFSLVGLLVIINGILATQSRGGLLGIAFVLGYFFYKRVRSIYLTGLAGAVGLVLLVVVAGISERQSGGAAEDGVDASAMGRIYAWQAAFNMAVANPVSGVGIDNFYANYFFYSPHWDGKNHAVHSTWLQVLAETGFVGLTLFIWLIATIYRALRRSNVMLENTQQYSLITTNNALLAGLLAFCVSGTFLTQAFTWPLFIILALAIALDRAVQSNYLAKEQL